MMASLLGVLDFVSEMLRVVKERGAWVTRHRGEQMRVTGGYDEQRQDKPL